MGPQHIAAENLAPSRNAFTLNERFNGAAAHRCGKLGTDLSVLHCTYRLQWGRSTSLRKTRHNWELGQGSSCFNGAAAHRCGKHAELAQALEMRLASMGPQHIAAENHTRAKGKPCSPGGRFNGAAAHRCGKRSAGRGACRRRRASMGPQHIAAENAVRRQRTHAGARSFNGAAAHRCGKPRHLANVRIEHPCFNGAAAHRCGKREHIRNPGIWQIRLQWGRSTSLRKTLPRPARTALQAGFNGAAAHRCGKRRGDDRAAEHALELQWGRSTSLRKTKLLVGEEAPLWRFNGAAAHRCGKRGSSLAKRLLFGASMGPQHIAAENAAGGPRARLIVGLQWGRSTSLRKTQQAGLERASSWGFNGAAAHRCGKRVGIAADQQGVPASMGPQHIAAENGTLYALSTYGLDAGFNGAAAHRCGKRESACS